MFSVNERTLEVDYLVVGAGAMGMAFTDSLLTESTDSILIVDRHGAPGGHWNDAYPFVRLHSASATYGVNSTPLGQDAIESTGLSRGYYEQASAAEICSYFDRVMRTRFLPSGRVRYFPMCEYRGRVGADDEHVFVSLASGIEFKVKVRKKLVDATYTDTVVPSKRPPKYSVAPGMQCVPPNALPNCESAKRYIVVGAGKTGIDTCLWLLGNGIDPERITWIMPRDSWLLDREHIQPRDRFFTERMSALALQFELVAKAASIPHLFQLLHENGILFKIDERVHVPRFRCATVSKAELIELRRIKNVVRLGHVQRIEADRVVLDGGFLPTDASVLHIDCTTSGMRRGGATPTFNGKTITLQPIRLCQQCFSSALIAHLEANFATDEEKNRFAKPIPLPIRDIDWLTMTHVNLGNQQLWASTPSIRAWIANSRLDPNSGRTTPLTDDEKALIQRFKNAAGPAAAKLQALLAPREKSTIDKALAAIA